MTTSSNDSNYNNDSHANDAPSSSTTTSTSTSTTSGSGGSSSTLKLSWESQLFEGRKLLEQVQIMVRDQSTIVLSSHGGGGSGGGSMEQLQQRILDYETEQAQEHFWEESNQIRASQVHGHLSEITRTIQRLQMWQEVLGDAQAAWDMLTELSTSSVITPHQQQQERELLLQEFLTAVRTVQADCTTAELEYLLSGPYDDCPARIVLTAGAGGIEAMDWVADLTRMYTRYCERRPNWSVRKIDWTDSFSGYKSMELLVTGPKAYGWLQGEKGAHRLVRISPYNAMGKRQTTFAGVDVTPELPPATLDKLADIVIPETELEVTTMRSSGKGGQHVNKVSSGVRMKHLPSGISIRCTEERSQLANKNIALHRLKAQLLVIAQEQRVQEIRDIRGDIVEASWGTQIRSYVLHPYRQVKDTRTGWETTQTQSFLDGSEFLEDCIGTYLRHKAEKERKDAMEADLQKL
jgi:peptide chain release factor 2